MSTDPSSTASLLDRLDAVERRLAAHAAASAPPASSPTAGPAWGPGEVWGHMAEMLPHWLDEARRIVAQGRREPVRVGREESDPDRLAGIEHFRRQPPGEVMRHLSGAMNDLRAFVRGLDPGAWSARADYPRQGVLDLREFVDDFMVAHLEEHADQLDQLASG